MAVAERNYFRLREEYKIQMLEIFEEFTELPDKLKVIQLSILMNFEEYGMVPGSSPLQDNPKRFQNVLKSLPVDLVRISFRAYPRFVYHHSEGEHYSYILYSVHFQDKSSLVWKNYRCARIRDTFAASCQCREKRCRQNLAGIWVSFLFLVPQGPLRSPLFCAPFTIWVSFSVFAMISFYGDKLVSGWTLLQSARARQQAQWRLHWRRRTRRCFVCWPSSQRCQTSASFSTSQN